MVWALAVSLLMVVGCGANPTEAGRFQAGELDPYGCPYVDAVPWEGTEAHQDACGPGCDPFAAWPPGEDNRFVACVAQDVPRWPAGQGVSDVVICLRHPVDGDEYCKGDPGLAYPLYHLCWRYGAPYEGELEYPPQAPPDCLVQSHPD